MHFNCNFNVFFAIILTEFKICGDLYEIKLDLTREDYNVIIEFLLKNFNEKGVMEIKRPQQDSTKTNKGLDPLPLKPRYHSGSGSRTSLSSRSSGKGKSITFG